MDPNNTITIIDNESVGLWFHTKEKIVHHCLRTFVYGDTFRNLLLKGAEVFREKGAIKWLSDDRGNSALRPEDSQWGENVWRPIVLEGGWKYWAVVMPEKVLGQMNMRRFIKISEDLGVEARAFSDPDEAFQWLASK